MNLVAEIAQEASEELVKSLLNGMDKVVEAIKTLPQTIFDADIINDIVTNTTWADELEAVITKGVKNGFIQAAHHISQTPEIYGPIMESLRGSKGEKILSELTESITGFQGAMLETADNYKILIVSLAVIGATASLYREEIKAVTNSTVKLCCSPCKSFSERVFGSLCNRRTRRKVSPLELQGIKTIRSEEDCKSDPSTSHTKEPTIPIGFAEFIEELRNGDPMATNLVKLFAPAHTEKASHVARVLESAGAGMGAGSSLG